VSNYNSKAEQKRLDAANEFIKVIASCGRNFFTHESFVSYMELSEHGRVFFIDYYTKKRIYTHRKYCHWDGFTSGGTMKSIIEALRDFIKKGETLRLSYFFYYPRADHTHCWGYGEDLKLVHDAAKKLGVAK
jgi:hypothetical protein